MKLSELIKQWHSEGCPELPQPCSDLESPDDSHSQCCNRERGHRGKHRDIDEWV